MGDRAENPPIQPRPPVSPFVRSREEMLKKLVAIFGFVVIQVVATLVRRHLWGLHLEHALGAGVGAIASVALFLDAYRRFPLGTGWLVSLPPALLGPLMGRYGVGAMVFWVAVYVADLRTRGRKVTLADTRCPRCGSTRVVEIQAPQFYCLDCEHEFDDI